MFSNSSALRKEAKKFWFFVDVLFDIIAWIKGKFSNYQLLLAQPEALLDEHNALANLSNAMPAQSSPAQFGFYWFLPDGVWADSGAFSGGVSCVHIALGKGVCGGNPLRKSRRLS